VGTSNTYQAIRLRDIAIAERPQERLKRLGPTALSDIELLAMLLRSGTQGMDVLSIAGKLMSEAGSLAKLITWTEDDFREIKGIGKVKALQEQRAVA
jgi:DNA repair protein RadC